MHGLFHQNAHYIFWVAHLHVSALTLEKDKAKANPEAAIFQRKLAASGGIRTHNLQRSRPKLYQLSYRDCSAG